MIKCKGIKFPSFATLENTIIDAGILLSMVRGTSSDFRACILDFHKFHLPQIYSHLKIEHVHDSLCDSLLTSFRPHSF